MARRRETELSQLVDRELFIRGITRRELAEKAGVTYQHMNNVLVSRNLPGAEVSATIAEVIGEKPEKLRKLMLKCHALRQEENLRKAGEASKRSA